MELDAVQLLRGVRDCAERRVLRESDRGEVRGHARDAVAVAHPDVDALATREAVKDFLGLLDYDAREAELTLARALDLAAEQVSHELHPVADAEDRHPKLEDAFVDARSALVIDARW